tara:strand:+ start:6201 stop:6320 length:120 start_codon:yes stop_codon:yes gene_type:complete
MLRVVGVGARVGAIRFALDKTELHHVAFQAICDAIALDR